MPFWEKTFLVMTDEGIIYSCCGLIYPKKDMSDCAMRPKQEGLLVVKSLWLRCKRSLKEGSCSVLREDQERNLPKNGMCPYFKNFKNEKIQKKSEQ
jgi:hypothetical protein